MNSQRRLQVGRTDLTTGDLLFGTSALGNRLESAEALAVLRAAAAAGLTDWDTSNNYGRAEEFIGAALPDTPASIQVFTKVGPVPGHDDFSGDRVRASIEESRHRLGIDRFPLVHLHDPERISFDEALAPDGPVRALLALQEEGVIGHLGVAGGPIALLERFVRTGHFDAVITHNRYSLLDRSADSLLTEAAGRGIAVFNAAPFGGGALSRDAGPLRNYHYRAVDAEQERALLRIRAIASEAGVSVGSLALGLSRREPRITATIVGATAPGQIAQLVDWATVNIPDGVWAELDDALPPPSHQTGPHGR
ncbi:aldo/keto reductase [Promicromonospora aerolata]|uniref:Aldo/keto reductase n=1 Tax=Promicromonospora aerolata TaxID=195749 RepID=A0ABW4V3W3_9MICO